jgi:hypothetical protein
MPLLVEQLFAHSNPADGDGPANFMVDAFNRNTSGPGAGATGSISATRSVVGTPRADNFVLAFEAGWALSRIATERRNCLEAAHDVHAGQWDRLRRRLLATLADTADHYGAGRLFNQAIGRRVRRASASAGAPLVLDWEKGGSRLPHLPPATLHRRMT